MDAFSVSYSLGVFVVESQAKIYADEIVPTLIRFADDI